MPAKRRTLTPTTAPRTEDAPRHHFFAASAAAWRVGYDLGEMIDAMRRDDLPFNVWLVPGDKDTDYEISMYAPQVIGATWLAFYAVDESPATARNRKRTQ